MYEAMAIPTDVQSHAMQAYLTTARTYGKASQSHSRASDQMLIYMSSLLLLGLTDDTLFLRVCQLICGT
jgi:hypothetical protein